MLKFIYASLEKYIIGITFQFLDLFLGKYKFLLRMFYNFFCVSIPPEYLLINLIERFIYFQFPPFFSFSPVILTSPYINFRLFEKKLLICGWVHGILSRKLILVRLKMTYFYLRRLTPKFLFILLCRRNRRAASKIQLYTSESLCIMFLKIIALGGCL
jgi:hypothetical protein